MPKPTGKLAQVTGNAVDIDPAEHYDGWAKSYDADLLEQYGYSAHQIASQAYGAMQPDRAASVLDVGCGTGLVATELTGLGFGTIDGVDVSAGMLAEARALGLYRALFQRRIGASDGAAPPLSGYGGVICVGSFGMGHMGPEAFGHLIDMAAPGAPIVILMNAQPFNEEDYPSHIAALSEAGRWSVAGIEDHNYMRALDRPGKLILARRV